MKKIYSEEFKKNIINQCLAGTSVAAISKKYGIAKSTLYIWLKSHTSQSAETISKRDHFRLKQKCDQQEKAIEILCLAFNVESIPLADRYQPSTFHAQLSNTKCIRKQILFKAAKTTMLKYTRFANKVFKQFRFQISIVLILVYDNTSQ